MNISLKGKTILVTGGSRGIGKAAALALAGSGARVICHYNSSAAAAAELEQSHGDIYTLQADIANTEALIAFAQEVSQSFGIPDVVINNAGVAHYAPLSLATDVWTALWDQTQAVNLRGAALLCKFFLPGFKDRGSGIFINVSSRAAHRGDTEDYLAYAASKGGLEALTKSLARAFGKHGILAYGIAPGFTRTDMAEDFIREYGEAYALEDIALTSLTTPQDIAPLFVFLSSGLARHATGTTIDVNAASYVR